MNSSVSAPEISAQQIEAARYAVLRRLAPCLRHHMVRPLQPIGLIYGVMRHKLSAEVPDLQAVRSEADKIKEFAKAALDECVEMGTWLAPEKGVLTDVGSGVGHCVGLLASMLHFCGFRLVNDVGDITVQVKRDALRMVLIAALLELTDSMDESATVTISVAVDKHEVGIVLQLSQKGEGSVERYDDGYRKLAWSDVQALAAEEDVNLSRAEAGTVTLGFVMEPASPVH